MLANMYCRTDSSIQFSGWSGYISIRFPVFVLIEKLIIQLNLFCHTGSSAHKIFKFVDIVNSIKALIVPTFFEKARKKSSNKRGWYLCWQRLIFDVSP